MIGLYSLVINFWTSTAQDLTIICHMTYLRIIVIVFDCNAAPPINTFLPWPYASMLDLVWALRVLAK